MLTNCQDVAKALFHYARLGDSYEVILFLFPNSVADKILKTFWAIVPGTKTIWELGNMILP